MACSASVSGNNNKQPKERMKINYKTMTIEQIQHHISRPILKKCCTIGLGAENEKHIYSYEQ